MSGTLTVAFRSRLLRHIFMDEDLGFIQFELALTKKVPSSNASPTQLDEPIGMSYARQPIALGDLNWDMSLSGEATNSGTLYFPTATGNWGVLTGWALITDEDTPIVAAVGSLVQPYRVLTDIRPYLPVGGLVVGLHD